MQRTGQRPCADVSALRRAGHRRPDRAGNSGRAHCQEAGVSMDKGTITLIVADVSAVSIYATPDLQLRPEFASVLSARASTPSGRHFDRTSPAVKSFVKRARNRK